MKGTTEGRRPSGSKIAMHAGTFSESLSLRPQLQGLRVNLLAWEIGGI